MKRPAFTKPVVIKREDARRSAGRPVKLVIARVGRVDLEQGQYVQGCLVEEGVYAVTDSVVAIVNPSC